MYKVGDEVTIRSWKSLVNEFGTYDTPNNTVLSGVLPYFSRRIANVICGKSYEITDFLGDSVFEVGGLYVGVWGIDKLKTGS